MEFVRENLMRLTWRDDGICAMLGIEFHASRAGFGMTVPVVAAYLAAIIEEQAITP